MAAVLFRGGTRLCVRCIHRELCRLVWRPQTALFSSKPTDRKQPRRTHIKKAKPQPAVDVAKLLEQLFSQRRPDTVLPAARHAKASSTSTKPPTSSSMKASTSDPSASTLNAALLASQPKSAPPTSFSSDKSGPSSLDFAADSVSSATPTSTPAAAQIKSMDSGVFFVSHTEEPSMETTIESPVQVSHKTQETSAAFTEPVMDVTVNTAAETKSTHSGVGDISHAETVQPLVETVEPSVETTSSLEGLVNAVAECSVETTMEADTVAQAVKTSVDSGVVHYSANETLTEPAISFSDTALNQNARESAPLALINEAESTSESTELCSGNVAIDEGATTSEQMTSESVTVHAVKVLVESLKTDELLLTKSTLDGRANKQLPELLVHTGTGAEYKAAAQTEDSSEREIFNQALSKWGSLSEDLQELEGESDELVKVLLCQGPAAPDAAITSSASGLAVGVNLEVEEKGAEAMTLESITLSNVKAEVGGLETELLLETRNALEKEAEVLTKEEKMDVRSTEEHVDEFEDTTEAEILRLDSISEATDAIEAEASIILEAMFGSEPRQPSDADKMIDPYAGKEPKELEGSPLEAMTLESVTLAEVEASLGSLESLSEATDYLEKEADVLAGGRTMEVEGDVASDGTAEALIAESLSEGEALSEALQRETLTEELLFSVPGHVRGVTESPAGQEVIRATHLDATAATGSVITDPPTVKEVQLGWEAEEEEAQAEALGNEGTHTDFDPVQRLFLEKIREYKDLRRLNEGLLEEEPLYKKYLSEETAKLQRLYGGGDLSSFPEFTFTEPQMDKDPK